MVINNLDTFLKLVKEGSCPQELSLNLRGSKIGDEGAKALAVALKTGPCPQGLTINLIGSMIGAEGAKALAAVLETGACPQGLSIHLSWNNVGDEGAKALAAALQTGACPQGLAIHLRGNKIGPKGAKAFAAALKSGACPQGLTINLMGNKIGTEGAKAIAAALKTGACPQGISIELWGNNIGEEGEKAIGAALNVGKNKDGLPIDLYWSRTSRGQAQAVIRYIKSGGHCPEPQSFYFPWHHLSVADLKKLKKPFQEALSLRAGYENTIFEIVSHSINSYLYFQLKLREFNHPAIKHILKLSRHNLNDMDLRDEVLPQLKKNNLIKHISHLDLSYNHLTLTGVNRLVEAFKENTTLEVINLRGNRISYSKGLFLKLHQQLETLPALKRIYFGSNFLPQATMSLFSQKEKYYSYEFFTSKPKEVTSLMSSAVKITAQNWVIALVCKKKSNGLFDLGHAMLFHEGMTEKGQRFFERYHIQAERIIGKARVYIEEIELKDFNCEDYHITLREIEPVDGKTLKNNILQEQGTHLNFSLTSFASSPGQKPVNCVKWCQKHLSLIDIHINAPLTGLPRHAAQQQSTNCVVM